VSGRDLSSCKSCQAPILWAKSFAGNSMPLDATATPGGQWQVDERGIAYTDKSAPLGHVSHFATCPDAKRFKKPVTAGQSRG